MKLKASKNGKHKLKAVKRDSLPKGIRIKAVRLPKSMKKKLNIKKIA